MIDQLKLRGSDTSLLFHGPFYIQSTSKYPNLKTTKIRNKGPSKVIGQSKVQKSDTFLAFQGPVVRLVLITIAINSHVMRRDEKKFLALSAQHH